MDRVGDAGYIRLVKELAKTESPRLIENASATHALTIVECLFDAAIKSGKKVRIVSGRLADWFYSDLVDKAEEVLRSGAEIKVAVVEATSPENLGENSLYEAINAHPNGTVHFVKPRKNQMHFVVVGNNKYRVEVDDARKKAFASFNDSTIGMGLVELFKELVAPDQATA